MIILSRTHSKISIFNLVFMG